MANEAVIRAFPAVHTKLSRQQITGFWGAWAGWTLDGMDSVIYALVLSPALTELLPKSGIKATPANVGFAGSTLFALFLVGWGLSLMWGPIADKFGRSRVLAATIEKSLHPKLKCQKLPDLHGPVLCPAAVLINECAHGLRSEQPALLDLCFGKQVVDHFFQVTRQPVVYWGGKTGFWLL